VAAHAGRASPVPHFAKAAQPKQSRRKTAIHWTTTLVVGMTLAGGDLAAQQPADREPRRIESLPDAGLLFLSGDSLDRRPDGGRARKAVVSPLALAQSPQGAPARPGVYMNIGFSGLMDAGWSSEPDVASLQRGDHDPAVRGFTIPNEEITLDGAVDPYFKGFVNLVYKVDPEGESAFELEEAYVLTTSLPANLQLRAGQFFTEFGRQNQQHPHAWAFVDQPLVLNRMFGPDGMRGQGARLSWLAPTSWYTEAMVSVLNSLGETMYSFRSEESSEIHGGIPVERGVSGGGDMVVVPRVATSFDMTPTQTVLLGVSGAFGPNNSGASTSTHVYGADLYWKWKSPTASQGFPFVSWQSEVLYRRYDAADRADAANPTGTLGSETLRDRGAYSQVLWGIRPRIVAGLRGDWARGNAAAFDSEVRASRVRLSPNFTYYPSEFSKVRLQYNFDDRKGIGRDHSIWLQFEFIMGAHAAHRF
jgi:hypothetical protein